LFIAHFLHRKCAAKAGQAGYDDGNDYAEESEEDEVPVRRKADSSAMCGGGGYGGGGRKKAPAAKSAGAKGSKSVTPGAGGGSASGGGFTFNSGSGVVGRDGNRIEPEEDDDDGSEDLNSEDDEDDDSDNSEKSCDDLHDPVKLKRFMARKLAASEESVDNWKRKCESLQFKLKQKEREIEKKDGQLDFLGAGNGESYTKL